MLAFAVGMGGLLFVFSLPDPFTSLLPLTPLLTPRDWPGSHASIVLGLSGEWPWREQRGFHSNLELPAETYTAGLGQIAIWYADPVKAAAEWDRLDRTSYKEEPFVTRGGGDGEPEHMLFCGNESMDLSEGFRECYYLAYREHWFVEISYRSTLSEEIHARKMQEIAARVDLRLMSAPDEPCYRALCTNTEKGIER